MLTADLGFGRMAVREGRPHAGIIQVRLAGLGRQESLERVVGVLEASGHRLGARVLVIGRTRVRLRPPPVPGTNDGP